ncbi:MAG: phosphoribosyltransferase [Alphaproteobacteria bacterium]|nr:phosphoribosyltransferase [Alphaproteobacteria bacterium]
MIANRNCLIVDDIIDSGKTLNNAINILKKAGARNIKTCITHNFKNL